MHSAFERNELTGFRQFVKEKADYSDSLEETIPLIPLIGLGIIVMERTAT